MLQATLRRSHAASKEPPIIVTHLDYRFIVAEQMAEKNLGPAQILLEPTARNTAIAIATAAHLALQRSPDAILFVQAADHIIQKNDALYVAVKTALPAAALGQLMTFGITPDFAATGYGYIAAGDEILNAPGCSRVQQFIEKPDAARAEEFLHSGKFLWNSGMFLLRADCYLHELKQYDPIIFDAAAAAMQDAQIDDQAIRLPLTAYESCPARSIDHAVMEHTMHAGVVPCDLGWSDIGNWSALWDIGSKDNQDNVVMGDAVMHATENCYIRSEGQLVATYGIKDTVVVATPDVVMVSSRHQPQDIKFIIAQLQADQRDELTTPRRIHRPWGYHETIVDGDNFKVRKISIKPQARLSLQRHQHRSEHWVVVSGVAKVEITESKSQVVRELRANTSAYIPRGSIHRLSNIGDETLKVIEIQCGEYLGADDVERFADDHHAA